jgi:hypothetical protein
MSETKVVDFPGTKSRARRRLTGDDKLVDNVRKAWRALQRAIKAAEYAGLIVERRGMNLHTDLEITRQYR